MAISASPRPRPGAPDDPDPDDEINDYDVCPICRNIYGVHYLPMDCAYSVRHLECPL